jgi:integrase
MRKDLSDHTVKALAKNPTKILPRLLVDAGKSGKVARGERYEIPDTQVPGLIIRAWAKEGAAVTFCLNGRIKGTSDHPIRFGLGRYAADGETGGRAYTLADARAKARLWRDMLARGVDPRDAEEQEQRENARKRANTFAAVAEDFITAMDPAERKREEVARDIRRVFVAEWVERPVADITRADVLAVIKRVKETAPHQARNLLGYARRVFARACDEHDLSESPCERIKANSVLGRKVSRKRVLSDNEIRAFWKATQTLDYPYGPLFQLLLLTGARKSEIAEMRRSELRTDDRVLVVPPERHKSDRGHLIWFSDSAWEIVERVPKFSAGDFIFTNPLAGSGSTRSNRPRTTPPPKPGQKPVNGFSKAKDRLDSAVAKELGCKPDDLEPFVIHDLRRSMRSRLATLPIPNAVCELMIGHSQSGLVETYSPESLMHDPDYGDMFAKLKHGWRLWEQRLQTIIAGNTSAQNVLPMLATGG